MSNIIVGSIVALISFILGLFGNIWYAHYQENKRRDKENLKNHFDELDNLIRPLKEKFKGTFNELGEIVTIVKDEKGEPLYTTNISNVSWPFFEGGESPQFSSHFPEQAKYCDTFIEEALSHNEEIVKFENKLSDSLNKKTNYKSTSLRYNKGIPKLLRAELGEIVKERISKKEKTGENYPFQDRPNDWGLIKIDKTEKDKFVVHILDKVWIETENEEKAKEFNQALSELLNSETLVEQMHKIFNDASRLESKAQNIASSLNTIHRQYTEFGKILKRKKTCPTCKIIFGG